MITLKTMPDERAGLRQRSAERLEVYEKYKCTPVVYFGDIQPELEKLLLDVLDDLEKVSTAYEALLAECRKRGISFDWVEV